MIPAEGGRRGLQKRRGSLRYARLLRHVSPVPPARRENPSFNAYSGLLLDLKENQLPAVEYFLRFLHRMINPDIPVAVVPSHDPAKTTSGLRALAMRLAAADRIDATGCLVRTMKIDKLATGGSRDVSLLDHHALALRQLE